ncbi:hypothetical protein JJB07_09715 [Tumebacillus sp. ITR2]|uniref:Uncharacterized protein n=1 Tax=Tumebacillus amylolyticus TaxID=2801339 RepID=A0ABS1J9S8_9BACL|nr:hypothetical protein [Tumebacillus amylolyticus]MBL0386930.1 hypothetical protein [Tumebacillus amylolyticus]
MAMLQPKLQSVALKSPSTGKNIVTMLLGTWLIGGVFVDGFAHNHGVVETFFTPWHAILYSGFVATAAWILWMIAQIKRKNGVSWAQAVPRGYGLGVIGIFVFLLGGLGDMAWHEIFGIEKDVAALLSPTHLILLAGALLILTSPFRVGWTDSAMTAPTWREFLPVLLSTVLTVSTICFFLMYAWMFRQNIPAEGNVQYFATHFAGANFYRLQELNNKYGLVTILLDTIVLVAPMFLLMSRWKTPFGTYAFLFGFVGLIMGVLDGFMDWVVIPVILVAGLLADVLLKTLNPSPERMWGYRVIALAVPLTLWGVYYAGMAVLDGIGWAPELWAGSVVEAMLVSLGVSLLALPPRRGD